MARKKDRISTSGGSSLTGGNPFGELALEGLKAAPENRPLPPSRPEPDKPGKRGSLLLRRLKAGKGGKVVTEISGFSPASGSELTELLKRLQRQLGTGGTVRGSQIELQGECREAVKPVLEQLGFRVKGI